MLITVSWFTKNVEASRSRFKEELNPVKRDDMTRLCDLFDSKLKTMADTIPTVVESAVQDVVKSSIQSALRSVLPRLNVVQSGADADDEMDIDQTAVPRRLPKNHRPRGAKPETERQFHVRSSCLFQLLSPDSVMF